MQSNIKRNNIQLMEEPGPVVTNGMSQYDRSERNANAGIVVGITPADFPAGPLAGIEFQRQWEARAFAAGGSDYDAPAQRVGDFLAGRPSTALGSVVLSVHAGSEAGPTSRPASPTGRSPRSARRSRRSTRRSPASPCPTPCSPGSRPALRRQSRRRDDVSLQSVSTPGLYPAGEGAGYAGGILSAAIDGIHVAEAVALACLGKAASSPRLMAADASRRSASERLYSDTWRSATARRRGWTIRRVTGLFAAGRTGWPSKSPGRRPIGGGFSTPISACAAGRRARSATSSSHARSPCAPIW